MGRRPTPADAPSLSWRAYGWRAISSELGHKVMFPTQAARDEWIRSHRQGKRKFVVLPMNPLMGQSGAQL